MLTLLVITLLSFQQVGVPMLEEPQPAFPGGELALKQFLQQHVHYPQAAINKKEEGYVVVRFTVDVQGNVKHPHIIPGYRHQYLLEKEALRVVRKMPKWIPAKRFKKLVAVDFYLPISFSLSASLSAADLSGKESCILPVEPTAEYPGGSEAMEDFFKKNSRYALDPGTRNMRDRIFVQFTVDERGIVRNPAIIRPGKHPVLEKEAIRLVRLMPRWKPCLQGGKLVAVQWNLPLNFYLPDKK
ncbi:TonB family protein [Chitinophaga sancti]|uniref:TonB family C-terminal domain-containing protein n=1 Tax=Chitinophaga sancti TaxID=1004 RepID=A0A1K1QK74_9BACT|nr:TonB family protein [Chitinophaga sancti]WQD65170.1 TonB family protein [Chitinophaga sancti]WQG89206.1 TonB family protein [Chitinophaga sancti]SFW60322.1 TonB family C-terminal domain-containing protein [Chitinophaga sancti]